MSHQDGRRLEIMQFLLDRGLGDVNSRDDKGVTPMLKAAATGCVCMVDMLLNVWDVDPNQVDNDGHNGYDFSVMSNMRIRRLFQEKGVGEGVQTRGSRRRPRSPPWPSAPKPKSAVRLSLHLRASR